MIGFPLTSLIFRTAPITQLDIRVPQLIVAGRRTRRRGHEPDVAGLEALGVRFGFQFIHLAMLAIFLAASTHIVFFDVFNDCVYR